MVSYDQLRSRLLELEQILDLPIAQSSRIHRWESHREWDREKPGYEWVYPMIDENADGKLSDDEYQKFQRFKQKHQQWEKALKNS